MKRILVWLSVIGILCSMLLTGTAVFAESVSYQLDFAPVDMVYDTANSVWAKAEGDLTCVNYPGYAVVDTTGAAAVRKFVAPTDGTLKLAWGNGVYIDNGQGNLTGATVEFAVTDGDGNILFPTGGDVATVTEGTDLAVTLDVEGVTAGDEFYFVVMNPSVDRVVCVMNFGVILADETYSNGSGFLYADSTQGTNGWYHQYAETVTKVSAEDAASKVVALEFTEQEMEYQEAYGAWGVDDNILTGSWSNWGYVEQTCAAIRKLVMPRAGTFKLETIWGTTGVTVQNAGDSFDFVILNNDKEIIWPQNGGWFTVTATTPAEINLELAVEAGDAVYFVFNNGSAVPTPYTTASVLSLDDYQTRLDNGSGGYGAADISEQGNGGWYYLYAADVTEITAAEKEDELDFSVLNTALDAAAAITDLSVYTDDSAATFTAALTVAQAITEANTQDEIDAAAAALNAAIVGLTAKQPEPEPELPPEDANDPTVALQFTEQEMTYDATLTGWTADADNNCVIYPWASVSPKQNGKVAIRKFVAPIAGDLILKWGNGISVDQGKANFAITDKYGKILYGKVELTAGEAHELDYIIEDVEAGDVFYFVVYNHTVDGAVTSMHSAVNIDSTAYAENGNLANSANTQGASGWYYVYATDLTEVKASEYKTFVALDEQIAAAKAIPADRLALYSDETVKAFTDALAAAEALTEANTQAEIDAATAALEAAIKALTPKATADNVTKVTFTEKEMTFNATTGYWVAADDAACIITAPLNYPTPVTTTGLAAIRKLVMPQDGSLDFKWGNGVYIDNTSGRYTGATAEFAIADKNGNIVYPQDGGVAVIKEGTPLVLDFSLTGLKKGDELYFITFNPSMENVPVVYNFAVMLNGITSLQNEGGSLYEADKQGDVWYFGYASDVTFTAPTATPGDTTTQPESPDTGDAGTLWLASVLIVLAASVLLLGNKFRKGEGRA